MLNLQNITDVMTPSPFSVDINEKITTAQQLMNEKKIRHLPVIENNIPISILTDRDINLAVAANKSLKAAEELTVADVCTLELYKVNRDTKLSEVADYMAKHTIGSVIVTHNEKLDGIFTATDACKYLAICLSDNET